MAETAIVAAHGFVPEVLVDRGFSGADLLRRDMGYDEDGSGWGWDIVLVPPDFARVADAVHGIAMSGRRSILLGYSEGVRACADAANSLIVRGDGKSIAGAVWYEGYLDAPWSTGPGDDFPVLWIRNRFGRGRLLPGPRWTMKQSIGWCRVLSRDFRELTGSGLHVDWLFGPSHNWDRGLNGQIQDFIREVSL